MHQHYFAGAASYLTQPQRTEGVGGDTPTRVADDMGVACPEAEHGLDAQPGVHTGDDSDPGQRAPLFRVEWRERGAHVVPAGQPVVRAGPSSPSPPRPP